MVDVDSGHVGAVDGRSLNGSPLNHGHHRRSLAMLKAPARGSAQWGDRATVQEMGHLRPGADWANR